MKIPIVLKSPKGKTSEELAKEFMEAIRNFLEKEKIAIKNFAVSALAIYQMAKYFAVEKKRRWLDYFELDAQFYNAADKGYMLFYSDTEEFKSAYDEIVKGYNALRNYLTKKPYSTDKWVLNFDIQTLADGWDKNKEKENGAIILRKDDRYYLGIMHYDHKDIFTEKYKKESKGKGYEKMEYKYFPEASKMIPKCSTQLNNVRKHFNNSNSDYTLFKKKDFITKVVISRRVYDLNNIYYRKDNIASAFIPENKAEKKEGVKQFQKEYLDISKDKKRYRAALKDWIIFCIDFLKAYKNTSIFDFFKLKQPQEYKSLDEFYNDINALTYSHIFIPVSEEYLQKKNLDGELFIFEIHNKDWNLKNGKTKKGAKNLHTLYWEQLFSEENKRQNFVFKLNGGAELFFRPKTDGKKLCYKIKHNGNWIKIIKEDEKYFYVENKDKNKEEPVKVDKKEVKVVADRKRYAENTILFHCPITLNRVSENKTGAQMNADIRKAISDNEKVRIIGIDRGEKHLVYYSVIDQSEKIIEDGSLNVIGEANDKSVPYAKILEQRAKEREAARREWQEVEQIKDTKRGYVSQVVRKIADLAIQHNAIIVLEDLSFRFKQVRGGIEKSIYQQFEKQLIDKLSFLANKKETNAAKPGYPLNAYQLASPITAFKDMGKQTGIIFYTAAGYTSRTCPVCGFRRNVRFHFENIDKAREVIKNLNKFAYDARNNCFTITYSLNNFLSKEQQKESKAKNKLYEDRKRKDSFTLTTKNTIRYKWFQNESPRLRAIKNDEGVRNYEGVDKQQTKRGIVKEFDITKYFKGLLENAGILLQMNDLRVAISSYKDEKEKEKKFYEKLLFTLFLLTETRQNISNTEIDYIHCPECGFNSDKQKFQGRNFNGDANGAYNIARKGILILKKIKQFKKKNKDVVKMGWGDLSVSIDEWDKFVQK